MSRPRSKSVRFSGQDHFFPRTPSPSHSNSTLSSPEISSPLSLSPIRLPLDGDFCGRIPSPMDGTLQLDQCLVIPPPSQLPLFTYDLTRDPRGQGILPSLPSATLNRPALTPPVAKMYVTIQGVFQWQVEIRPKDGTEHITVKDVLFGVYDDLQLHLKPEDLEFLHPEMRGQVKLSAQRRAERLRQKEKRNELDDGIRRVDTLLKNHRFRGLRFDPSSGLWVLATEEHL